MYKIRHNFARLLSISSPFKSTLSTDSLKSHFTLQPQHKYVHVKDGYEEGPLDRDRRGEGCGTFPS